MSEWKQMRIGELGKVVTGSTPPSRFPDWFGNSIPFVTPSDIEEGERRQNSKRFLSDEGRVGLKKRTVPENSVAFVCIGATIGKTCLLSTESVTNQQINTVIPNEVMDSRFVYYLLKNDASRIAQSASGAATPIINKSAFSNVLVGVPNLDIQTRIGVVLGSLDDLIENNRRRVAVLEEMARAIYREWFVKFRYPGHESVPLVDSELGPIPEGWGLGNVESLFLLQRGFDLPVKSRTSGAVPVIGASGVLGKHNQRKVVGPGVTTGRSGTVGKVSYIAGDFWPLNTALWVKEFRLATPRYAYFFLSDTDLRRAASGAAVPTLDRKVVHALPAVCPPSSLILSWDAIVRPIFLEQESLRRQSALLTTLRDMLLPKLVTGQIDVSTLDLDALVKERGMA